MQVSVTLAAPSPIFVLFNNPRNSAKGMSPQARSCATQHNRKANFWQFKTLTNIEALQNGRERRKLPIENYIFSRAFRNSLQEQGGPGNNDLHIAFCSHSWCNAA